MTEFHRSDFKRWSGGALPDFADPAPPSERIRAEARNVFMGAEELRGYGPVLLLLDEGVAALMRLRMTLSPDGSARPEPVVETIWAQEPSGDDDALADLFCGAIRPFLLWSAGQEEVSFYTRATEQTVMSVAADCLPGGLELLACVEEGRAIPTRSETWSVEAGEAVRMAVVMRAAHMLDDESAPRALVTGTEGLPPHGEWSGRGYAVVDPWSEEMLGRRLRAVTGPFLDHVGLDGVEWRGFVRGRSTADAVRELQLLVGRQEQVRRAVFAHGDGALRFRPAELRDEVIGGSAADRAVLRRRVRKVIRDHVASFRAAQLGGVAGEPSVVELRASDGRVVLSIELDRVDSTTVEAMLDYLPEQGRSAARQAASGLPMELKDAVAVAGQDLRRWDDGLVARVLDTEQRQEYLSRWRGIPDPELRALLARRHVPRVSNPTALPIDFLVAGNYRFSGDPKEERAAWLIENWPSGKALPTQPLSSLDGDFWLRQVGTVLDRISAAELDGWVEFFVDLLEQGGAIQAVHAERLWDAAEGARRDRILPHAAARLRHLAGPGLRIIDYHFFTDDPSWSAVLPEPSLPLLERFLKRRATLIREGQLAYSGHAPPFESPEQEFWEYALERAEHSGVSAAVDPARAPRLKGMRKWPEPWPALLRRWPDRASAQGALSDLWLWGPPRAVKGIDPPEAVGSIAVAAARAGLIPQLQQDRAWDAWRDRIQAICDARGLLVAFEQSSERCLNRLAAGDSSPGDAAARIFWNLLSKRDQAGAWAVSVATWLDLNPGGWTALRRAMPMHLRTRVWDATAGARDFDFVHGSVAA